MSKDRGLFRKGVASNQTLSSAESNLASILQQASAAPATLLHTSRSDKVIEARIIELTSAGSHPSDPASETCRWACLGWRSRLCAFTLHSGLLSF
ncbi:hypothetical protein PoB_007538200 [Plakobranchus ocellatus]|uniref:Uncharacterized protein n=1 Tax=Plakobranchus ocellatus TaxID=259542 RepID=A0AAV4DXX3_9GAST|nr:hypothetical protein PoB_007538200 [Plakobranchus ocellatus]